MGNAFIYFVDVNKCMTIDEKRLQETYKRLDKRGVFKRAKAVYKTIHKHSN